MASYTIGVSGPDIPLRVSPQNSCGAFERTVSTVPNNILKSFAVHNDQA